MFIGLDPNTAFLQGVVDFDRWGFITTDIPVLGLEEPRPPAWAPPDPMRM